MYKKVLLLFLFACVLFSSVLFAQVDIPIGTGTTGNGATAWPAPLQDRDETSRAQFLYRASELLAAGMNPGNIVSIKYNITNLNGAGVIEDMIVRIGSTTATTLSATTWETLNGVVSTPSVNYQPVTGINTITFPAPFFWDGTSNIIIETCNGDPANGGSTTWTNNPTFPWTTGLSFNGSHSYNADDAGNGCGIATTTNTGTQTTRPNIIFNWIPASPCVGTPSAVTAVANPSNVCLGNTFTVSLSGLPIVSGLTYQWQSSSDNVNWSPILGANDPSLITTQSVTTYYRAIVTCNSTGGGATPSSSALVTSPPLAGGNYTIDNSIPTGGGNFQTFNEAYNFIKCGILSPVVFDVKTGTGLYNEQLIMTAVPGASAINTVTFKGNGVAAIGFGSNSATERAVIKLKGTRYIIFDSLIINANTGTAGYGVQLMTNADSNIVRNCTITSSTTSNSSNFAGIVINGTDAGPVAAGVVLCDYNTFSNNTIIGGFYGITLYATFSGGANGFNRFVDNDIKDFYQYGMYVGGSYNTIIERNTFSRPTRTSVAEFQGIFFTTEKNTGDSVSKNRIKNPFGGALTSSANFYGIHFSNSDASVGAENIVSNNLIYNVNGNGPQFGIANTGSDYVYYLHNTVSLDNTLSTSTSTTRGFNQTTTASGLFIYNNIVSITRGGTGAKHCIYLNSGLVAGADYNDYYVNAIGGTNSVGFYTANRVTLNAWKTATGLDAASISANPAYVDPANENYSPGNAGIDNFGIYVGIDSDIINTSRNGATPDIGAYEFTPPACSTPPVTGTTSLSATTVCQGTPVVLTLNIGAYGSAQTFQWQTSVSGAPGSFNSIGSPMLTPDTTILASTTLFYQAAVSCGSTTVTTVPVLLTVNPALPAGTYTIDNTTTTYTGPGTGTNFKDFNAAKTAMNCGILGPIVFNVVANSGPYNEQLILDSIKGTSPINTITFNGNGNTLVFNSTNSNERAVVKLRSADYIIFDSLTIDASVGTYGYGVQLINRADSNIFRRCTILSSTTSSSQTFAGVVINATETGPTSTGNTLCDDNIFDRNTIIGGYYGATLIGGTTASAFISGNKFTNNTIRDFYAVGIQLTGTFNTLIEGNTFTRPNTGITSSNVYGVYAISAPSNRLNISKNRFTRLFGALPTSTAAFYGINHNGVDASAGSESTISNNLFYALNGNGPNYPLYNNGSDNIRYFHNTISLDDTASRTNSISAGFYQTGAAVGIEFRNNMISVIRGGNGLKHAIYLATTTSEIASNFNNFYVNGAGANNYVGFYTTNRVTLADWKANANGKDTNSFSIDPIYRDSANGDFSPGITPLDNRGSFVGIDTDIKSVSRPLGTYPNTQPDRPDIGAFEFNPPACVSPPVAGTSSVTPNSGICLETPIHLTLTGNSPIGSLTFQWQTSPDGIVWYNLSGILFSPDYDTLATTDTYYRAIVSCNGVSTISTVSQVTLGNILLAGTYTINNSAVTTWPTGTNFNSFTDAVSALQCGIGGKIIFNAAAGTYNEQIRIPYIKGTSNVRTVTFQSASGVASSVNLTYNSTIAAANYTLKLDSAQNFIFRSLTISATNIAFGRVVDLSITSSFDSIVSCTIVAPITTSTSNNNVGIYANTFKGTDIVIQGNAINNGANGIYFAGTSSASLAPKNNLIDANSITGTYSHGIFLQFTNQIRVTSNSVSIIPAPASNTAGIYSNTSDSGYRFIGNTVEINNVSSNLVYGIYIQNSRSIMSDSGIISANKIIADAGNTGTVYGLSISTSKNNSVVNNVIAINSAGSLAYGLYSLNNVERIDLYNNSINLLTTASNSYAAYFSQSASMTFNIQNNIFSNKGGGKALFVTNPSLFSGDYNTLYTTGAILVQRGTGTPTTFANLNTWRAASNWDLSSISYPPAFTSNLTLQPDVANPDVWAMHGRGVQILGNASDINNNLRPVTLLQGVPDMGAYEFFPSSLPTVLSATPAVPAPNTEQTFMYGTDTVMKIKWGASAPPSIELRRYSGVVPKGLSQIPLDSMYFYTKADIPGGGTYDYEAQLFYIDPWLGSIPSAQQLGLGKTTASNVWVVGFTSRNDVPNRRIYQNAVNFLDKFTGLVNPYSPPVLPDKDSSNRGKRFWVGYPINQLDAGTSQQMVLYLSAQEAANVQVKINGTNWVRNYNVAANSVTVTEYLPKAGADNAYIDLPGLSNRGISITSDVPIVAYAHVIGSTSSGASMLMPVGVWGYEYRTLGITQDWGTGGHSYFYVVADNDNTRVEITSTPGVPVQNTGMTPGVPFVVNLNKGQIYQVIAAGTTSELSGSTIKSVPNVQGKCYPVASFSGSSRTYIDCPSGSGGGDFIMQQNFPATAWGKRYLTAPSSASTGANLLQVNVFRIAVKDPTTVVRKNGVVMTGLVNNFHYQYTSTTADYIEADKPIMVAQYLTGACTGVGDPEMIYLSPIEQGINKIGFYRNTEESIDFNLLTLIVPTGGLPSLSIIDGNTTVTPDFTYPHPQNGILNVNYTVVVKRWPAAKQQVRVQSDSAFTAITYGLGSVESYGYNAGTLVKSLQATGNITNTFNPSGASTEFTCVNTPFRFTVSLPLIPTSLTWKFSSVPNISPAIDIVIPGPIPSDSFLIGSTKNYQFALTQNYTFSAPGVYPVQVVYSHPDIESCDKTNTDIIYVQVIPSPKADFSITFAGCVNNGAQFLADSATANGILINQWTWNFHDGTTASGRNASYAYNTAGTFTETLRTLTSDGCVGDSSKQVVVNPRPIATLSPDSLAICLGTDTTFNIQNPQVGTTYNWYTTASGGTPVNVGPSFRVTNVTANAQYFVEAISSAGCASVGRTRVVVSVFQALAPAVVTFTTSTATSVTFTWTAVPGTASYSVSVNGGAFGSPSSGATGLTHTVSNLGTLQSVSIVVRANGVNTCQTSLSTSVSGCSNSAAVVTPNVATICSGSTTTFSVQNPVPGIIYTWYSSATGGTALATNSTFTTPAVTTTTDFYVQQSSVAGCVSSTRTKVTVNILAPLAAPVTTIDVAGPTSVTFIWTAVAGAIGYEVSIDNGVTFVTPSSGNTGLTHLVSGLAPLQQVTLIVRALGNVPCQNSVSIPVTGRALQDQIFIPNTFTPNGDGRNDRLLVYGYTIRDMQFMVFSQWGEKVFESLNQTIGWDGSYKGKQQPVGVYVYVAKLTLLDGSVVTKRGSINLVR